MPQARKSTRSSSRRGASFKEPAALKRLNQSLNAAQKALTDLRQHTGRDAAASTKTLYKGLGKFVSDARRDTGKFTSALRKDFEQAAKAAQKAATGTGSRSTSTRGTSSRAGGAAKRRTSSTSTKRSTSRSSSSSRSGGSRSGGSRKSN